MYWLVSQNLIKKEVFNQDEMRNDISISTAIRKVDALSKEEAIGKFILDTAGLEFKRRIDPIECFEFDKLKTI